jgi:NTE family protein
VTRDARYPERRIGIALGSGAAKGWAHIGVLKALHEQGIEPMVVTGCSIGAFVGAAYANDNLTELEAWVRSLTSWEVFKLLDVGVHRGGLISGNKVFEAAQKMLGPRRLEQSKKPFGAVATELYTGREIWLTEGYMRRAVRASCSMPGLFAPLRWHGQWVIDGAVSNPVPISICKALGATHVIAVDLQFDRFDRTKANQVTKGRPPVLTPLVGPELQTDPLEHFQNGNRFSQLVGVGSGYLNSMVERFSSKSKRLEQVQPNMMAVMSGALDILEDKLKRSRMAGDPPDVVITPKLANVGLMEFFRAEDTIEAGYQAVQRVLPQLEALPRGDENTKV